MKIKRTVIISLLFCLSLIDQADSSSSVDDGAKCEEPQHMHLSVGHDPSTSMTVSFSTPSNSRCQSKDLMIASAFFGTDPVNLANVAFDNSRGRQFSASSQDKLGNLTEYTSNYIHHIQITGLEPSTKYYYCCKKVETHVLRHEREKKRSLSSCCRDFEKAYFKTAPKVGSYDTRFAVVGDWARNTDSIVTAQSIANDKSIDVILSPGDMSYANASPRDCQTNHIKWESFFERMEFVLRRIPIQTCPGNHEIETDALSREVFVAYENYFHMPQVKKVEMSPSTYPFYDYEYGNAFYSYTYGAARIISLSSHSSTSHGSKQYMWLKKELESVNRDVTPWLIVMMHAPMYNTFSHHTSDKKYADIISNNIETLLVKHSVNLVFSGHVHAYMRTKQLYAGNVTRGAPRHFIVGTGGAPVSSKIVQNGYIFEQPEEWIEHRQYGFHGYGRLHILNQTHANWELRRNSISPAETRHFVDDEVTITNS
eukprot:CAMPEP_0194429124 /NCGR_PEP_ID=MMETSP0176-20130528/43735_1 /TAXON_ID=216777 /ORGANISM="Proboscia alata, Strain PI-D3" /LENGTH=481 /DNA_ID=CAMNT_0039241913 /DNA_START=88 /DNA_END=1530 /DNA_ORIENTATION=-